MLCEGGRSLLYVEIMGIIKKGEYILKYLRLLINLCFLNYGIGSLDELAFSFFIILHDGIHW